MQVMSPSRRVASRRSSRRSHKGIEVSGRGADGYRLRFVALERGNRVYLLGAHSKHATQKLYDALVASFVAT